MHFCQKPPDGALVMALGRPGRRPRAEMEQPGFFKSEVVSGGKVEKWD